MFKHSFLIVLVIISTGQSAHLPSYLKPCKRKDPDFSKCAIKSALEAIPFIADGDKNLKLPSLKPMIFPLLEFSAGQNFNLKLKNAHCYGLETAVPVDINLDRNKQQIKTKTHIDKVVLIGDYVIDAQISLLPIKGSGKANLSFINGDYDYNFEWKIKERNGLKYAEIVNDDADYKLDKVIFALESLFNGDEVLGKQMNMFLNENWKIVAAEMNDSLKQIIAAFCNSITSRFFGHVPTNELFID